MKSRHSCTSAAAILTGGLLFTGPAHAALVFSEGFEGGGGAGNNAFSMPIYTYASNYTLTNGLTPAGGLNYGTGTALATNAFTGGSHSLTIGGITGVQIDAGLANYDFSAQFSTYRLQNDHSELQVQFLDGSNAPVGGLITFGGAAFVSSLPRGDNGAFLDAAAWGTDARTGLVPAGARSLSVQVFATRLAGSASDGYIDNVLLQVNVVPEAGTVTLTGLAAALLMSRRRRRI
jgi:hypothetical protein